MTYPEGSDYGERDHPLEEAAERFLQTQLNGLLQDSDQAAANGEDQAVTRAWAAVGEVSAAPEMMRLRQLALRNLSKAAARRRRSPLSWPAAAWAAAAVFLLVAVPASNYVMNFRPEPQIYDAPADQRRAVTLADNSTIYLDKGAEVAVSYSHRARDIQLLRGQAEFAVAKDALRPFTVSGGGRRVVATGTLFNVDLLGDETIVTLLHGGVRVEADTGPHGQIEAISLKSSERLVFNREDGSIVKTRIDVEDAQAWRTGKLIFEAESLEDAINRVNRYSSRKVILAAPDLASEPITGVFNQGDPDVFAQVVSAQLHLRREKQPGAIILLSR